jgi:hypothetical protein
VRRPPVKGQDHAPKLPALQKSLRAPDASARQREETERSPEMALLQSEVGTPNGTSGAPAPTLRQSR